MDASQVFDPPLSSTASTDDGPDDFDKGEFPYSTESPRNDMSNASDEVISNFISISQKLD